MQQICRMWPICQSICILPEATNLPLLWEGTNVLFKQRLGNLTSLSFSVGKHASVNCAHTKDKINDVRLAEIV